MDDIATVIEFLKNREARSALYKHDAALPKPQLSAFHQLWPDDINFVLGPGLKGCNAFCRKLLIETEFESITVLQTKLHDGSSNPEPINATRYSLDDGSCKKPENGHRLIEGQDETLNLPNHSTLSAEPAIGLCFDYETVSIPENGAFVYFNHASPFWPDEFERKHTKTKQQTDGFRAMTQIIPPKAFDDLETDFNLTYINHIAYEFRVSGLETKAVFAFESACVRPTLALGEASLNLLISTHEASEGFIGARYPKSIFADNYRGVCTGNQRGRESRLPIPENEEPENTIKPYELSEDNIEGVKDSLQKYIETEHHLDFSDVVSVIGQHRKITPSQSQIDALIPIYESMFENVTTASWALGEMRRLPEGSLASHIKSLNSIRDKIAKNAGCKSPGCDGRYHRVYRTSPSVSIHQSGRGGGHWVPQSDEDRWKKIAGDGAAIYAAAGPKAIKDLEAAHKKGLGGAVYAMGCMGTSSEMIEELALRTVRPSGRIYPQPVIRHFLALRHSPNADAHKEEFKQVNSRVTSFYNSHIRAVLAWENKSSLCVHRNELY